MNAPAPKFMIESAWNGMIFTCGWKPANGGLDVLEPATGAALTRVGNATAGDVARAAAEARSLQPAWAATPYEQRAAIQAPIHEGLLKSTNGASMTVEASRATTRPGACEGFSSPPLQGEGKGAPC